MSKAEYKKNGDLFHSKADLTFPDDKYDETSQLKEPLTCRRFWIKAWHYAGRPLGLIVLLYFFICSLDLMSSSFRLIGGKAAGTMLSNNRLLENPIAGLMIGILITVAVQSSSTSTSIFITMVAGEILSLRAATFMIMGANVGTSITNTIVSMGQVNNRKEFRLAFAGATVHDIFNWLSVAILLPLEVATQYLTRLSSVIVESMNLQQYKAAKQDLLKTLTKPLTKLVIQLDSKLIGNPAMLLKADTMIKWCCKKEEIMPVNNATTVEAATTTTVSSQLTTLISENTTSMVADKQYKCVAKCVFMFMDKVKIWSDEAMGGILLVISLALLIGCLVSLVKLLKAMLASQVSESVKRIVNTEKCSILMGYVSIVVGALLTILVQSSSVFTSALTPLVGTGFITVERMYPLTLGSNIGTTVTGILAALASDNKTIQEAMQASMIHLFFNISGIIIWYPIPFMRRIPIKIAKLLGKTTSKYRWFAFFYLIIMFIVVPGVSFGLSLAWIYLPMIFIGIAIIVLLIIGVIKLIQRKRPEWLPVILRDWKFLPLALRSLQPIDNIISKFICKCCRDRCKVKSDGDDVEAGDGETVPPEIVNNPQTKSAESNSSDKMTRF